MRELTRLSLVACRHPYSYAIATTVSYVAEDLNAEEAVPSAKAKAEGPPRWRVSPTCRRLSPHALATAQQLQRAGLETPGRLVYNDHGTRWGNPRWSCCRTGGRTTVRPCPGRKENDGMGDGGVTK